MERGANRRIPITKLIATAKIGEPVNVNGWVKTSRFSKNVSFLHLFDGSSTATVQVVLEAEQANALKAELGIGTAVSVQGTWVSSPGGKQSVEIAAQTVTVVGNCDASDYPLQKKRMSFEHLRTIAHLRSRTNTFQSVFRVRHALAWQIQRFFQDRGFLWIHTPIIASSDCEGAGEMFEISATGADANKEADGFFGTPTFLTVSGQLEVECFAQSHTDVYTFGPTFRAENSNTVRHANEFWMIEPEMAFADLDDVIALAEEFIREVSLATIAQCPDDFDFFNERIDPGNVDAIRAILAKPFSRVTYAEAQRILIASGRKFDYPVGEGTHLQSEHERYLAEDHFNGPVFITDYPIEQKAFYMRRNDDGETVAATDLVVPRLGEIIGGSQREERLDVLDEMMALHNLPEAPYWWYRDLRRYGTTPHGGFGLGFERLLMWLTGMKNIRDVLPFPRTPGNAQF